LIILADVLHHVPEETDRAQLLADAAALVAADGIVLVKEWERTRSPAYWAGWAADYFISGDRAVRYLNRSDLTALITAAAPELHHRHVTSTRPWRCNVVHVLSREQRVAPRAGDGHVDSAP
jgi:2-polyprenyl-3-methyl-5-hydroxy-6-metoxy-1,4-benzoquinol methylase